MATQRWTAEREWDGMVVCSMKIPRGCATVAFSHDGWDGMAWGGRARRIFGLKKAMGGPVRTGTS